MLEHPFNLFLHHWLLSLILHHVGITRSIQYMHIFYLDTAATPPTVPSSSGSVGASAGGRVQGTAAATPALQAQTLGNTSTNTGKIEFMLSLRN